MNKKQRLRIKLVQALYQWQLWGCDHEETHLIIEQFSKDAHSHHFSLLQFSQWLGIICDESERIDEFFEKNISHHKANLAPLERGILWLGYYELQYQSKTPVNVVINEAINLSKEFGAQDSYTFIHYALDKSAQLLRQPHKTDDKTRIL